MLREGGGPLVGHAGASRAKSASTASSVSHRGEIRAISARAPTGIQIAGSCMLRSAPLEPRRRHADDPHLDLVHQDALVHGGRRAAVELLRHQVRQDTAQLDAIRVPPEPPARGQ